MFVCTFVKRREKNVKPNGTKMAPISYLWKVENVFSSSVAVADNLFSFTLRVFLLGYRRRLLISSYASLVLFGNIIERGGFVG